MMSIGNPLPGAGMDDRFQTVRRKLTDLNYRETFGVESLDLVDHLLQDLLSTTQSYKQIQDRESRLSQDLSLVQSQLFPLRKENARLARENHDLHVDNIKLNEDIRMEMEQFSKRVRILSDEITELKLLNKVADEQLRAKDFLIDELRDAYESVADPALKSRNLTASSIKISTPLPPSPESSNAVDPRTAWERLKEQVPASKEKNETLAAFNLVQSQLQEANVKVQDLLDQNLKLKSALSIREQELSRAGRLIGDAAQGSGGEGGISSSYYDNIANSAQVLEAANKRIIDQLNGQVDFLNDQLAQREAQIALMTRKWAAVEQLESDLDVRNAHIDNLKEENSRLAERVRGLERKILSLAGSAPPSAATSPQKTVASIAMDSPMAASAEWKAFQDSLTPAPNADVLQQLQLEKERTANQAELLKVMQQRNATLEAEMEALHTKNKALEASSASKTLANRTVLPKPSSGIVSATITKKPITPAASITSKSHAKESAKDKELIRDLNKEVEDLRKANKTLSRQLQDLQAQLHQSSTRPPVPMASNSDVQLAEQLRQDNIFLQQSLDSKQALVTSLTLEYDKLAALHAQTRSDLDEARSKLMTSEGTCRELEFQLSTLNDKYQKLMEVSARVQSDRDHIQDGDLRHRESLFAMKIELEERNDEVRKCRQEIEALQAQLSSRSRPASTPANPLLVPSAESHGEYKEHITELQAETNLFKDRYRELQEDYAELMQAADVQKQGHAALQQQYSMLSTDYNSLKDSYAQVQKKVMALEVNQTDLQHVCSMESRKRQNAEEELSRLRAETTTQLQAINQLKDLVQTMSQNLAVEQNRVKVLERTMKGREEQEQWHDEHKAKATETIHLLEDEVNKYKQIVYILDQEKDDLHDKLDVLEEKNRQYAQEIRNLQSKVSDYESEVVQLQKREEKYKKDVAAKINALGLLEAKCNNLECQYSAAKESLQQKAITLNHHSEDLMLMTKENQVLNNTLINLNNELTHVKGMQQDAQRRIRTLEEEKKIMEIEKNDLLVHYKTLVKDKQHLEEDIKVLSSQQREGMNSASSLSRQLQDCQELLKSQSSALQNHAQERAGLQTQVVQLNELVVQLQRKVEAVEADNRRMIQETHGLKQTNAMLNERLTIVMKRASSAQENSKVLTARLGSVERERDGLRAVLEMERQRALDMSKLAETARIEAATKEIHIQRLQSEVMTLSAAQAATGSPLSTATPGAGGPSGTPPTST